jgi:glycosyltransferase involved in cell wall biosynthesis
MNENNQTPEFRVIVAHPGKQHSYRLAEALEKSCYLFRYITTVYDNNSSLWMKIIKKFISKKDLKRANSRSSVMIPRNKIIQFCELRGLLLLGILRIDKKRVIYNRYYSYVAGKFGRKVARYAIKHHADIVICYDSSAQYCFEYLKKYAPDIIRIIDNAAMNRYGLFKIYQQLETTYNILKDKTGFKEYLLEERKSIQYRDEAFLADYHIAASSFSKYTLTSIGVNSEKIAVIPYGVDISRIHQKNTYSSDGKLKVIYVGELSPQKGIYSLLRAIEFFNDQVEFNVVGSGLERLSVENQKKLKESSVFHGYMLQGELFKLYSECDVFLFPTLGDGFGFVVIEAMAAGLPIICSNNSVGTDAVKEHENGFTFQAGDNDEMINHIQYFVNNRHEVARMGRNAAEAAKRFSWEAYGRSIESFVKKVKKRS